MADSKIEWTDKTWNPTTGCDRTSPGCDNCYALTLAKRLKAMGSAKYQLDGDERTSGPGFGLAVHEDTLNDPFTWRKPSMVFVNSMSDLFHKDVRSDFIASVFRTIQRCPQHTFQVLTKRSQRLVAWSNANNEITVPTIPNWWQGVSIESARYTFRADHLRAAMGMAVRFLSLEPLLGPLPSLNLDGIDWVIVGGESGRGAGIRPMHPDWVRDIRDQCDAAGVAFFFKQWGQYAPWADGEKSGGYGYVTLDDGTEMASMGKHDAGRVLDGRTHDAMPALVAA